MDFLAQLINPTGIPQLEPSQVYSLNSQATRPYLLDVRTPGEYKSGHIQGAELIPLNELASRIAQLPKGREIVCVCESGSRSSVAARHLQSQGYKVSNLRGGMGRWVSAGLPVKTGPAK
jgi:rhodanese-related sulfurtransferase